MRARLPPVVWVNTTYFAEGLPYMIVRILSSVFFTDIGAKERYLGYLNFLGIPWNLKFLWAPLVDAFSTTRRWMITIQFLIALLTFAIALLCMKGAGSADPSSYLWSVAVLFVVLAFVAATNDISIDAYYMAGLETREEQALWSGHRVMAYRMAMVFARSGLVAFAAYMAHRLGGDDKFLPWFYAFAAGSLTMAVIAVLHLFALPRFEQPAEKRDLARTFALFREAFGTYLGQEKAWLVIVFVILYKIGDEILFSMSTPFLMRELGITKAQYAWVSGVVGAVGSILGAMGGGWWIKRRGLRRAIWPLTLFMNLNILAYVALAWARPDPATSQGIWIIAAVHGYEQFAAGVGSAVLLVYLLGTCLPAFKASHYAIGSAVMSIPSTFLGGFAGRIVEEIGYLNLFLIAFAASIPSMALIPRVPIRDDKGKP